MRKTSFSSIHVEKEYYSRDNCPPYLSRFSNASGAKEDNELGAHTDAIYHDRVGDNERDISSGEFTYLLITRNNLRVLCSVKGIVTSTEKLFQLLHIHFVFAISLNGETNFILIGSNTSSYINYIYPFHDE